MVNIENVINDLMTYYYENCCEKPLEYAYGFFDALGVIIDIKKTISLR